VRSLQRIPDPNWILGEGKGMAKREGAGRTGKIKGKGRVRVLLNGRTKHDKISQKIQNIAQLDILTTGKKEAKSLPPGTFPGLKTYSTLRDPLANFHGKRKRKGYGKGEGQGGRRGREGKEIDDREGRNGCYLCYFINFGSLGANYVKTVADGRGRTLSATKM